MTQLQKTNRLNQVWPTAFSEMDRLFDDFLGSAVRAGSSSWYGPLSVSEAENTYHIELDVPGVAGEDVQLTFEKGNLQITVERKLPEGERKSWHNERGYGTMTRVVSLPDSADPESISAELNQGVLHITIAKRPEAQPKRIDVKVT